MISCIDMCVGYFVKTYQLKFATLLYGILSCGRLTTCKIKHVESFHVYEILC
jgi:hypothetical protein